MSVMCPPPPSVGNFQSLMHTRPNGPCAPPDQACHETAGGRGLQPGDRLDIVVPEERPTAVVQGGNQVCTLASEGLGWAVVRVQNVASHSTYCTRNVGSARFFVQNVV
jgi:hypothetical protein